MRSQNGDEDTGTGFVAQMGERRYIVTCKHVIFDQDQNPRNIIAIEAGGHFTRIDVALPFSRIDVCLLQVVDEASEGFPFKPGDVLSEIITAGYPRVRMREGNPLLLHKGHLNGWTESENAWERAGIISADVAPGSSGGPVLNTYGAVVGVVDQQIETQHQTGTTRYNAMVPAEVILAEREQYDRDLTERFLRSRT